MQGLRLRAEIIDAIREFFRSRGSLEVETPAIVPSPGADAHLDAIAVALRPGGDDGPDLDFTYFEIVHLQCT